MKTKEEMLIDEFKLLLNDFATQCMTKGGNLNQLAITYNAVIEEYKDKLKAFL